MKKKLTPTQQALYAEVKQFIGTTNPMPYDTLKSLCKTRSFDSSFNVLYEKGYVERVPTDDYSNQFKLTK